MKWTFDGPLIAGPYAILYCYDAREGLFDGALEWDNGWSEPYPIVSFAGPFETLEKAKEWASKNNPEDM